MGDCRRLLWQDAARIGTVPIAPPSALQRQVKRYGGSVTFHNPPGRKSRLWRRFRSVPLVPLRRNEPQSRLEMWL